MHDLHLLTAIVIIFGTGLIVARMFRVLRAPSIIGFLFAGVLIGPAGAGLIAPADIEALAEVGLVLLLFTVGVELSPAPLLKMGRSIFVASALQIVVTVLAAACVLGLFTDWSAGTLLLVGIVVALSSTAIVLKQLSDRGETETLVGIISTGVLLVQDVFVVLVMLLLPLFMRGEGGTERPGPAVSIAAMVAVIAVVVLMRFVLPTFIERVVRPGGRELVTLFAVVMACGGAWLAGMAGWPLPLGACIAGLMLAEADERHQIAADILPFRDAFNALFFISLGMLLDPDVAVTMAGPIALAIGATLVAKTVITAGAIRVGKWSWRPAIQVGVGLCTVSEFGFVLAREADRLGGLPSGLLDGLVVYALGTMACGAFLVPLAEPLSRSVANRLSRESTGAPSPDAEADTPENHTIIVGYGLNGQNLARVLKSTGIPFTVIEMNPLLVRKAKKDGATVIVGDASSSTILDHAGLTKARALVIAINDPHASRYIVGKARDVSRDLFILARTRFVTDIENLYQLGADLVVPEEFETSIEIAAHVLRHMDIPDNIVEGQIAAVRSGRYAMLRGRPTDRTSTSELGALFQLTATRTHYLFDTAKPCGQTVGELNLRARSGVTIIAIVRSNTPHTNPPADFVMEAGDVLVLVGAHAQLDNAKAILEEPA